MIMFGDCGNGSSNRVDQRYVEIAQPLRLTPSSLLLAEDDAPGPKAANGQDQRSFDHPSSIAATNQEAVQCRGQGSRGRRCPH